MCCGQTLAASLHAFISFTRRRIDQEEFGDTASLYNEGMGPAVGMFLVGHGFGFVC